MRKILGILLIAFLTSNMLYGAKNSVYDTAVEIARTKNVDNVIKRINNIDDFYIKYILLTGDLNPSKSKVQNFFNLDNSFFTNYEGNNLFNVIVKNKGIEYTNIFDHEPSDVIKKYFNISKEHKSNVIINSYNDIEIPYSSSVIKFINKVNELKNSNEFIISNNVPNDKSKYWLKPNGIGGLDVYRYDNSGNPIQISTILNNNFSGNSKEKIVVINGADELNSVPKLDNIVVIVSDGQYGEKYVYDKNIDKWIKISNISGNYIGTVNDIIDNINPLVDRDKNKKYFEGEPGSRVEVLTILGNDSIKFEKYSNYWKSINKYNIPNFLSLSGTVNSDIYVAQSISDLPSNVKKGSVAYLLSNNLVGYKGNDDFPEAVFDGLHWNLLVPDLNNLVLYGDPDKTIKGMSFPYRVANKKLNFKHIDINDSIVGYWLSEDNKYYVTKGSRKDLQSGLVNANYLSWKQCATSELCSKNNSKEPRYTDSGIISNELATNSIHKFFEWIVLNTPKSINGLIDMPTCPNDSTLNLNKLRCEKSIVCNEGTYDKNLNRCVTSIKCPSGYSYNIAHSRCEKKISINRLTKNVIDYKQATKKTINKISDWLFPIYKNSFIVNYDDFQPGRAERKLNELCGVTSSTIQRINAKTGKKDYTKYTGGYGNIKYYDKYVYSYVNNPKYYKNNKPTCKYVYWQCNNCISKNSNVYGWGNICTDCCEQWNNYYKYENICKYTDQYGYVNYNRGIGGMISQSNFIKECAKQFKSLMSYATRHNGNWWQFKTGTSLLGITKYYYQVPWSSLKFNSPHYIGENYNIFAIRCKVNKITYTCPSGYTLNGTQCVKTVLNYYCPTGYYTDGTKCSKIEYTSPLCNGMLYGNKCLINPNCDGYNLDITSDICYKLID